MLIFFKLKPLTVTFPHANNHFQYRNSQFISTYVFTYIQETDNPIFLSHPTSLCRLAIRFSSMLQLFSLLICHLNKALYILLYSLMKQTTSVYPSYKPIPKMPLMNAQIKPLSIEKNVCFVWFGSCCPRPS